MRGDGVVPQIEATDRSPTSGSEMTNRVFSQ
jgi:hypothetical protein